MHATFEDWHYKFKAYMGVQHQLEKAPSLHVEQYHQQLKQRNGNNNSICRHMVSTKTERGKSTPRKTNMTVEEQPFESMYLLSKIR